MAKPEMRENDCDIVTYFGHHPSSSPHNGRCVAANAALDHLRRSQRAPAPLEGELAVEADPAQALERAEAQQLEREEARRLLAGLSRDERELLAWRAIEGGAWAELAERRGEPASTLRARYSRLCASLRKESPRG